MARAKHPWSDGPRGQLARIATPSRMAQAKHPNRGQTSQTQVPARLTRANHPARRPTRTPHARDRLARAKLPGWGERHSLTRLAGCCERETRTHAHSRLTRTRATQTVWGRRTLTGEPGLTSRVGQHARGCKQARRKPPYDGGPNRARSPPIMDPQGKPMGGRRPGRSGGIESRREAPAARLHQTDVAEALLARGDSLEAGTPTSFIGVNRRSPLP